MLNGGLNIVLSTLFMMDLPLPTFKSSKTTYSLYREVCKSSDKSVYSAKDPSGKKVFIKFSNRSDHDYYLKRESSILSTLPPSPHIVKVVESGDSNRGRYLVTEAVDGTQIGNKIRKVRMRRDVIFDFLSSALKVAKFLATYGVYHQDLKPDNMVWVKNLGVVLLDFETANEYPTCGTPLYMPKERFSGSFAKERSEAFSLAMCARVMTDNIADFEEIGSFDSRLFVLRRDWKAFKFFRALTDPFEDLLNRNLSSNYSVRDDFDSFLARLGQIIAKS